jgi:NTP pyrophosphatase (non-canonical NTP hydrolase)
MPPDPVREPRPGGEEDALRTSRRVAAGASAARPVREETGGDVLVPVVVSLCDRCLDGEGGECHTPGCALWMNRAPDVAIRSKVELAASASSSKEEGGGRHESEEVGNRIARAHEIAAAIVARIGAGKGEAAAIVGVLVDYETAAPSVSQQGLDTDPQVGASVPGPSVPSRFPLPDGEMDVMGPSASSSKEEGGGYMPRALCDCGRKALHWSNHKDGCPYREWEFHEPARALAAWLVAYRHDHGLTQAQLADRLYWLPQLVEAAENAEPAAPSVSQQGTGERARSAASRMLDEFHRVFAHPDDTPASRRDCREALHEEEHAELMEALRFANATPETRHVFLAALARELADVVYVAYGTAHAYELDLDAALAEVHRANMSKLRPDGEVLQDERGKVIKGPSFVPPDMTAALASAPSQQEGGGHG